MFDGFSNDPQKVNDLYNQFTYRGRLEINLQKMVLNRGKIALDVKADQLTAYNRFIEHAQRAKELGHIFNLNGYAKIDFNVDELGMDLGTLMEPDWMKLVALQGLMGHVVIEKMLLQHTESNPNTINRDTITESTTIQIALANENEKVDKTRYLDGVQGLCICREFRR